MRWAFDFVMFSRERYHDWNITTIIIKPSVCLETFHDWRTFSIINFSWLSNKSAFRIIYKKISDETKSIDGNVFIGLMFMFLSVNLCWKSENVPQSFRISDAAHVKHKVQSQRFGLVVRIDYLACVLRRERRRCFGNGLWYAFTWSSLDSSSDANIFCSFSSLP